ncbi:MAG TPA: hypothetical protein VF039_13710 [Longimicrobiales bacterium]
MSKVLTQKEKVAAVLNEATLLGITIDPALRTASICLHALTLPDDTGPSGTELEVRLIGVTRAAFSIRDGNWTDRSAPVVSISQEEISEIVDSFGHLPIYGDNFLDSDNKWLKEWGDRLSLNWILAAGESSPHSFDFFQEGHDRHLDARIWFETIVFLDRNGVEVRLDDLVQAANRWWAGMRAGDPRTASSGIAPLK